jgi:hypothetical protein
VTFAQTSFACGTHQDARVAYIAAFVLARYNIESSVATALNVGELDEEVWSTPLGTYRCIIVGKAAFDLLPERSQEWVFFPPPSRQSLITGVRWGIIYRTPSPGWRICCSAYVRVPGLSLRDVGKRRLTCSSAYEYDRRERQGTWQGIEPTTLSLRALAERQAQAG